MDSIPQMASSQQTRLLFHSHAQVRISRSILSPLRRFNRAWNMSQQIHPERPPKPADLCTLPSNADSESHSGSDGDPMSRCCINGGSNDQSPDQSLRAVSSLDDADDHAHCILQRIPSRILHPRSWTGAGDLRCSPREALSVTSPQANVQQWLHRSTD